MRGIFLLAAAAAAQTALSDFSALAGTFVEIAPPESGPNAIVLGLNDRGDIAGSFFTGDGGQVGYVGPANGPYETFTVDSLPTQPRALNNQGVVTGIYFPPGNLLQFARDRKGEITTITKDGTPLVGIVQGASSSGEFVGDYFRAPGSVPLRGGYRGRDGEWQADIDLPFPATRVAPRAMNARGDIVGWFIDEPGSQPQGFAIIDGVTSVINFPDAVTGTFPASINNKGEISGGWNDADGLAQGFILDSDLTTWTTFDTPRGLPNRGIFQINDLGQVAVFENDGAEFFIYVYCRRKGGICKLDPQSEIQANERAVSAAATAAPVNSGFSGDPDADPYDSESVKH